MSVAEFEEKEFELAANLELGAGGGFVMAPGQVLEEIVGYDAVAAPAARHVIWRLLKHHRPPGVRLLPQLWQPERRPPSTRLPTRPISLVVQYKRPHYLQGARAAQWRLWNQPYFRFERSEHQHRVLLRLERELGAEALVRYAAPAFWTFGELEGSIVNREVLRRTGFARPSDFKHHRVWTYQEPGVAGRPNPSGPEVPFEVVDQVLRLTAIESDANLPVVSADPIETLMRHLERLATSCRNREPALRRRIDEWKVSVRQRDLMISAEGLERVADLASISSLLGDIGATWIVGDSDDPPRLRE